jgi:hypothetical protein
VQWRNWIISRRTGCSPISAGRCGDASARGPENGTIPQQPRRGQSTMRMRFTTPAGGDKCPARTGRNVPAGHRGISHEGVAGAGKIYENPELLKGD